MKKELSTAESSFSVQKLNQIYCVRRCSKIEAFQEVQHDGNLLKSPMPVSRIIFAKNPDATVPQRSSAERIITVAAVSILSVHLNRNINSEVNIRKEGLWMLSLVLLQLPTHDAR